MAQFSLGHVVVVGGHQAACGMRRDRVEDRVERKQRVASKYICVTSRLPHEVPSSEKWMCAGRQALGWLPHG